MDWTSAEGVDLLHIADRMRDEGATFAEIAEALSREAGESIHPEQLRGAYRRYLDRKMESETDYQETIDAAKRELQEKHQKRLQKKLLQERAAVELILDVFRESVAALPRLDIHPPKPASGVFDDEEALLLLSDMQIGERVSREETNGLGAYDIDIFRERMQTLSHSVRKILEIHRRAYSVRRLNIFDLGDNVEGISIFRGQVHHLDVRMADQFLVGAQEIAKFIVDMLSVVEEIEFTGIIGNHGRMGKKDEHHAMDNWDYLLYRTLQLLLANYADRITWNIPTSNWTLQTVNGQKFLLLHGDTVKSWNGIPYYGIDRADARFTAMLAAHGESYRYMCLGHHHNPSDVDSPGGEKIMNGTFVGGSDFSINKLHTSSRPSQWLFGVHHRKGLSWRYKIYLDEPAEDAEAV